MSVRWLVPPSARILSPNRYHAGYRANMVSPVECLILHYTAGYSHLGSARWLADEIRGADGKVSPARASAHFVVGRAGEVVQLVSLDDRAWHAGGASSRWRGHEPNPRSIGIEIANLGPLDKRPGRDALVDTWGRDFAGPTIEHGGRSWEAYPEAQLLAVGWLVESLAEIFPVLKIADEQPGELPRICGHQDVDPTRKIDPGPAFPLAAIRAIATRRLS